MHQHGRIEHRSVRNESAEGVKILMHGAICHTSLGELDGHLLSSGAVQGQLGERAPTLVDCSYASVSGIPLKGVLPPHRDSQRR